MTLRVNELWKSLIGWQSYGQEYICSSYSFFATPSRITQLNCSAAGCIVHDCNVRRPGCPFTFGRVIVESKLPCAYFMSRRKQQQQSLSISHRQPCGNIIKVFHCSSQIYRLQWLNIKCGHWSLSHETKGQTEPLSALSSIEDVLEKADARHFRRLQNPVFILFYLVTVNLISSLSEK